MLILLISLLVLFALTFLAVKSNDIIVSMILSMVVLASALIFPLYDPLHLDVGNLKFSAMGGKEKSIELIYEYINDKLDGLDTISTIESTLNKSAITISGSIRIDSIEKNTNGYKVKFEDGIGWWSRVTYTLLFYENEENDVLAIMKKGDILNIKTGVFNSITFDEYENIVTISFKECEVGTND